MLESLPDPNHRILDSLRSEYNLAGISLTFLPLGADPDASVYRLQTEDQASYFVKLKRNAGQDLSSPVLSFLSSAGIKEVIAPLKTLAGATQVSIGEFTLAVAPFIDGQNGFDLDLAEGQWSRLGEVLCRIHTTKAPSSLQSMLRRETYSPKWREQVRSLLACLHTTPARDEIATACLGFIRAHEASIEHLVERAERLSNKVQTLGLDFVLCHADIHAGNVLIDKAGCLYIVDWDAPTMAPKERDLMFIGAGVGNVWNREHEEAWFYKGYGPTIVNQTAIAYYRHERIIEDIAVYSGQLLLSPDVSLADRMQSYQHFTAQFQPQGVVDVALRSNLIAP